MIPAEKIGKFTVLRPDFHFELRNLFRIKSFFTPYMEKPEEGFILDLSGVGEIDSMGYRFIHNLVSSLKKHKAEIIVFSENRERLEEFRKIVPDTKTFDTEDAAVEAALKASCSDAYLDVQLECLICSCRELPRRVVNRENLKVHFKEGAYLPQYRDLITGQDLDLYRCGIIVCPECLMTSFYHTDFINIVGDRRVLPEFSYEVKSLLTKTINRRRDILQKNDIEVSRMQSLAVSTDSRDMEFAYRLGADTLATISFDRSLSRFFEHGLAHLLAYFHMPERKKEREFIQKADTAFKECLKNRTADINDKVWQSYYYIIVLSFLLDRTGASLAILEQLRREREKVGPQELRAFDLWYRQSQHAHEQAIQEIIHKYS
ncbi:MAG: STAS domain-containing protein, partial [Fibrobacterota bacterium]